MFSGIICSRWGGVVIVDSDSVTSFWDRICVKSESVIFSRTWWASASSEFPSQGIPFWVCTLKVKHGILGLGGAVCGGAGFVGGCFGGLRGLCFSSIGFRLPPALSQSPYGMTPSLVHGLGWVHARISCPSLPHEKHSPVIRSYLNTTHDLSPSGLTTGPLLRSG